MGDEAVGGSSGRQGEVELEAMLLPDYIRHGMDHLHDATDYA